MHVPREPKDLIDRVGDVCRIPVKLRVENAGRLGDDRVGNGVLDLTGARQFEDLKRLATEVQRREYTLLSSVTRRTQRPRFSLRKL